MRSWGWSRALLPIVGVLMCGAAWAFSSPVGSSPDDTYHLASIWCDRAVAEAQPDDSAGDRTFGEHCKLVGTSETGGPLVEVPALVGAAPCYMFDATKSASCQSEALRHDVTVSDRVDTGDYPGGYYRVMHLLVGDNVGESVLLIRIVNVAIATLLMGLLWLAGSSETRRATAYTYACVLVPMGWFILASVNPSAWALVGISAYALGLHQLLAIDVRRKRRLNGAVMLVGAAMAFAARGETPIYAGLVTVAVLVLNWRLLRSNVRLLLLPAAVLIVGMFVMMSAGQVAGTAAAGVETDIARSEVLANLAFEFPLLVSGLFGYGFGLGWVDTQVYAVTAFPVALVLGFLMLTGAARAGRAKALAVTGLAAVTVLIPMLQLYKINRFVGEAVQPRYILPLVPVVLLLLLIGKDSASAPRLTRGQSGIVWAMTTVASSAALHANIRRYITGADGPRVFGEPEWWWAQGPSPGMVWVLGSLGFAAFAATVVAVSWQSAPAGGEAGARAATSVERLERGGGSSQRPAEHTRIGAGARVRD